MKDLIERQAAIDAFDMLLIDITGRQNAERVVEYLQTVIQRIKDLPSAQPELIAQSAYVRGFEQGKTQEMIDANLQQTCNKLATAHTEPQSPCDLCVHNPPSSMDGKPCCMCVAEPWRGEEDGSG